MTQIQLNRAVAAATGEDIEEVARRGFSLVEDELSADDDEHDGVPHFIDWDQADEAPGSSPSRELSCA